MPNSASATSEAAIDEKAAVNSNAVDTPDTAPTETTQATPRVGLPKELNQRINQVDAEITELRAELAHANKSVKSRLTRLDNKQTDLTSRVSEAYQQLGELGQSYQGLADKSARINDAIQALTTSIDTLAANSEAGLEGLTEEHQALVARTEQLANKSRLATQALNKGIRQNAKALQELESRLLGDIESLSQTTQERDQALNQGLDATRGELSRAQDDINTTQARLIKLQAVDQALDKRAQALEATTAELTQQSRQLAQSTRTLTQRSTELGTAIAALQARADNHETRLDGIDAAHAETRGSLLALGRLERRHFRGLTLGLVVIALALSGLFLFQRHTQTLEATRQVAVEGSLAAQAQQQAGTEARVTGLDAQVSGIDAQVGALQNQVSSLDQRASGIETGMAQARQESDAADAALDRQLASLDQRLTTLNDQVDSIDGRVGNLRPGQGFGHDNVIHGPQWLAAQPADHYLIHIATVADKQQLYTLAQRYGHYLKDELSYLANSTEDETRYALFMGNYASRQELGQAFAALPSYLDGQRPQAYPMQSIQAHIGQ